MLTIGSLVRVKEPFSFHFSDVYVIEAISATGAYQIAGGVDFDAIYLELVE
jgi:hypothetical protein